MPDPRRTATRSIIGTGPAGATAADVLTGAGWSVIMLEKGRNHLLALDAPFGPLGHVSNDEIKFFRRHFLGPDPFLEPRTYRRDDADGDRAVRGRGQQPALDRRRRRLPRRRQAPPLPRRRLQGRARSSARSKAPTSSTGPSTTTRWSRTTREAENLVGVAGLAGANPFAEWRSGEYPMPPGADMFGAVLTTEAAHTARLQPVPARRRA